MTYEVEKEMVLNIGVRPVIEYLQEKHIWVNPDGDMDPIELLNYTAQIVQAKEVSKQDIVNWLNPNVTLSTILDDKDAHQSDSMSQTNIVDFSLYETGKTSGFLNWPITEQGNSPFTTDIFTGNSSIVAATIPHSSIEHKKPPVNSPMDNHVALLDMIGLSEPKVDLITEDDITPEVLDDLVGQYIKLYKDKPIDVVGMFYHRIQFMKDDLPQPLSTGAVLALAKKFTDLGFFTDVTTSPFTGVENNVIHIGLMFTVIHGEQELIYHL